MTAEFERLAEALARSSERYRVRKNPPGRRFIVYRHADYSRLRDTMLAALDVVEVTTGTPPRTVRPLAGTNHDPRTNWLISLIDAWAIVGDILMFYQDRIVNEGYLGTACEAFSLDQLTRSIGARRGGAPPLTNEVAKKVSPAEPPAKVTIVTRAPAIPSQLRQPFPSVRPPGAATAVPLPVVDPRRDYEVAIDPGAAAVTDMVFQVTPQRATQGRALVRAGTAIRSHRVDGGAPLLFETSIDLDARLEYNAMKPPLTERQVEPALTCDSIGLAIEGTSSGLQPGDHVLIIGDLQATEAAPPKTAWLFGPICTVEPNRALGTTLLTWSAPGGGLNAASLGDGRLTGLQVFGFGKTLAPFGEDAKPLEDAPLATQVALSTSGGVAHFCPKSRRWERVIEGLPPRSLSACAITSDGTWWIGGAFGAASCDSGARGWSVKNAGLGSAEVIRFAVGADGATWVATSSGQVSRTAAYAKGWSSIAGSFMLVSAPEPKRDASAPQLVPVKTSLPRTPVTSVQPFEPSSNATSSDTSPAPSVLVATGLGIYGNPLDGKGWLPIDPRVTAEAGTSNFSAPMIDLCVLPARIDSGGSPNGYAVAATTDELYVFSWYPLPAPAVVPPAVVAASGAGRGAGAAPPGLPPLGKYAPPPGELRQILFIEPPDSVALMVLTSEGAFIWRPSSASAGAAAPGSFVALTSGLDSGSKLKSVAAVPPNARTPLGGVAVGNDGAKVWVLKEDAPDGWQWQELPGFPGAAETASHASFDVATTIAVGPSGDLLATAPLVLADGWPDFRVVESSDEAPRGPRTWIDVDSKPLEIAPRSWVVATSSGRARVFSLRETDLVQRSGTTAFGQPGRAFRLLLDDLDPDATETFDPRTTDVLVRSFALPVARRTLSDLQPISGDRLELDGLERASGADLAHGPRLLAFTGQRPRLCVTLAGGLYASPRSATGRSGSNGWREGGFGFQTVSAILSSGGELWVATDTGVSARLADGKWEDRSAGLGASAGKPRISAFSGGQLVFAATSAGLYRWETAQSSWAPVVEVEAPLSLAVSTSGGATRWWVGTAASGLWSSRDGKTFSLVANAQALVATRIDALAALDGALFVGTPQGTYLCAAAENAEGIAPPRLIAPVAAVALAATPSTLLAGTDGNGVWTIESAGSAPRYRAAGLAGERVAVLAHDEQGWLAGTGGGLFASADTEAWVPLPLGVPTTVLALALDGGSTLYVGTAVSAELRSRAGTVSGELRFSVVMSVPGVPLLPAVRQELVTASLRRLFDDAGQKLPDDAELSTLEQGQRWLLSSKADPSAAVYVLSCSALGRLMVVQVHTTPTLCGGWPTGGPSSYYDVELADVEVEGTLTIGPGQWVLRPPLPGDESVSEVRRIQSVSHDAQRGVNEVRLEGALASAYARRTLSVSGNVVRASQGETINAEILGSGDSGVPNQRFQLKRAPLTFLPVPPPEYRRSTLKVSVAGMAWQEIDDLTRAERDDRVYSVVIDHEGRATLTFGDGVHGARLPSGIHNVLATYRVGLGAQGDVAAGTLDVLLSPPPGIRSVTNPIPATRGVDPASAETIRNTVPRSLLTGNRVVTMADAAALASSYPGVREAVVAAVKSPRGSLLQVSVAFDSTVTREEHEPRCSALALALRKAQAQPAPRLMVGVAEPCYFGLEVEIFTQTSAPAAIAARAFEALFARFSPSAARIGEDVRASEVEAILQAIHGVAGCKLKAFTASAAHTPVDPRSLKATPAHYDAARTCSVPANLLVLTPPSKQSSTFEPPANGRYHKGGVTLQLSKGGAP